MTQDMRLLNDVNIGLMLFWVLFIVIVRNTKFYRIV